MNRNFTKIFAAFAFAAAMVGCNEPNSVTETTCELTITASVEDNASASLSGVTVKFTDTQSLRATEVTLDATGSAVVELSANIYTVEIEEENGGNSVLFARVANYTVKELAQSLDLTVIETESVVTNSDFIISEYFFNGSTTWGRMMHPDQFIVLYNPTAYTLYADGISFATTDQGAWSDPSSYFQTYMDSGLIPVVGLFTIPGSGKQYPVEAGEKIVIAMTAQNHYQILEDAKDGYADADTGEVSGTNNCVDLSGADFEVVYTTVGGAEVTDTDNPDAVNLIISSGTWASGTLAGYGAYMHPRGAYNLFIFRMDDGAEATVTSYVAANTEQYTDTDGSVINMLSIPSSSILDGVVSCDRDIVTRPLPTTVDRGLFQVSGCHSGEFAKRKIVNGAPIDTNNTSYDFEMLKYQTPSYGAGWRD